MGNFSLSDYGAIGGFAAGSGAWGYAAGHPRLKAASVATGAILGTLAGFMYSYQNSFGRLTGFKDNSAESKTAALVSSSRSA